MAHYEFLHTHFVPDRVTTGPRKDLIHVTGPEFTVQFKMTVFLERRDQKP